MSNLTNKNTPKMRKELLNCLMDLPILNQKAATKRLDWVNIARTKQLTPEGDWDIWLNLAGRGYGKTRVAVEDIWWYAFTHPKTICGVVCATNSDTRETAFEGESGFMECIPEDIILKKGGNLIGFTRKPLKIELINGSIIKGYSAEDPRRLRGPSFHRLWADELAAWQYEEAWDMAGFCLRLGNKAQAIVTTTPKPRTFIKKLIKDKTVLVTKGSTFENKDNLAPNVLKRFLQKYGDTRLGRQELYAEILDDTEGALWTNEMLTRCIYKGDISKIDFERIAVAVDPAGSTNKTSDETGIVVVGCLLGHYYILEDASEKYTPDGWASKAVYLYHKYGANVIIGERNYGGDMVEHTLQTVDRNLRIELVTASRGKFIRAEPIAALYEQNKVFHAKWFNELHDQMTTFVPGSKDSPDRLDALVWGMSYLANISQDGPRITML